MPSYATFVKASGAITVAIAAIVVFITLSLVQTSAADAAPEPDAPVTSISAVVEGSARIDVGDGPQVELICSLAHVGNEQAQACKAERAKANRSQAGVR